MTKHTSSGGNHLESQQPGKRYTNWSYLWFSSVQYIFLMNVRIGIGKPFHHATTSRSALWATHPPTQWELENPRLEAGAWRSSRQYQS